MPSFQNPSMTAQGKDENFILQVSRGHVANHEVRNIFGYQANVTTSFIPAWEYANAYVFPDSALKMTVNSTSESDNTAVVRINGLDANYREITETVVVNTASPNQTTQEFLRINDVLYFSGGGNKGEIKVSNNTHNYAAIRIGDGRNQASIYTVPADKYFFLYRIDAFSNDSTAAKPGLFKNVSISNANVVFDVARTTFNGNMNIQRRLPFKYAEKTDIQFQLSTFSGTHEMNVFAEGILIDD